MKSVLKKSTLSLALAASLIGSSTWSTDSLACSSDPYISSVCVMALSGSQYASGFGGYLMASGQSLTLSQYQALYALIGTTYGGDGRTNFALPDMRGRVVVGADVRNAAFLVGKTGGAASVALTAANLPAHAHTLSAAAKATVTGTFGATTTLSGLTTTTNLGGVNISGVASGLKLYGSTTNGTLGDPTGNALGTATIPAGKIYTASTPAAAMNGSSIGGNLSLTIASGTTAPGTATGTASTTITGSPTVAMSGATDVAGSATPTAVSTMPPYLAMYYFIATQGLWPAAN